MPAVKTVAIIAALLIGIFLSVGAFAQALDEANVLSQQEVELSKQGYYSKALPLAERALAIREKALGPDHLDVALSLYSLASLYLKLGRYADAEPLFKRSLVINQKAYGLDHPIVAIVVNNLAELYRSQGRYADAEPLYKQSLAMQEKAHGSDHPNVAVSLNNLAGLYQAQGRYGEAEPLLKRSLAIEKKAFGPNHRDVALSLENLAGLYFAQGRYTDAEPFVKRALAIRETLLGASHPDVAVSLNNVGELYRAEARYADAEPFYKRSLTLLEEALGPHHPDVAQSLNNLAELYKIQGRYVDAEPLFKRSLAIRERALGQGHPEVARSLNALAELYGNMGRYADAEPLAKRSLATLENAFGPNHPDVAASLHNLAELYRAQGIYADAQVLLERSIAIREQALGPTHPYVLQTLNDLAMVYQAQGRYADAELLFKEILGAKSLDPDHPTVAIALNNLAEVYIYQGRYADAEPLLKRSLKISEKVFGQNHRIVASALNNLATLYQAQGRYADAEPLYRHSLAINEKVLGPDHSDLAQSWNNLAELYKEQGRYVDALPIVQKVIATNHADKFIALDVLYGSQSQKVITPREGLDSSYKVIQRSMSSVAGEAISKLAARFASGTNELSKLVRKDQDLTAETDRLGKSIISAVSKSPTERNPIIEDQMRKRIAEIKSEREKLQDVFNQRFPDYVALSKPQSITIEQTQALLADDEALITIDLDKSSYVWVITKDRAEWKELSISAEGVSKEVEILRAGLNPDAPKPFDRGLAYQLYRRVLGPIEEVISQKARLSFVLDGALTSLPPQVLITSDPDGKDLNSVDWLIRKYAVTVLPSVGSFKILRGDSSTVPAINPLIGFGDPIFERTAQHHVAALNRSLTSYYRGVTVDTKSLAKALPALPETADELRAIAKILGAKSEDIILGEAASVTTVNKEPLANYRVVYFATHALVAGEVEKFAKVRAEPALVLSIPDEPSEEDDGLLRASDVAMLKLNADFVVLSACNTAAGDKPGAEALSGLARAFFYAGARSLVVSHWEVDSDSTVELMEGLFDALKANPHLSHAEALRASMLRMIGNSSKPEWAQPQFWAPFVVVGEPQKR